MAPQLSGTRACQPITGSAIDEEEILLLESGYVDAFTDPGFLKMLKQGLERNASLESDCSEESIDLDLDINCAKAAKVMAGLDDKIEIPRPWSLEGLEDEPLQPKLSAPTLFPKASPIDHWAGGSHWQDHISNSNDLIGTLHPGDVLSVIQDGFALSHLGAAGGWMGHVLLVVSPPRRVKRESDVGVVFEEHFANEAQVYLVGTVECCRNAKGITELDLALSIDQDGQVYMCGDCAEVGSSIMLYAQRKEAQVWRCPSKFRADNFHPDVMHSVLEDMRSNKQSWSWSTAARAMFFSSEISSERPKSLTMKEIESSWEAEPICTSVVVIFWQRYLRDLATLESSDPCGLILQHMPLRADRVLPGELLSTMFSKGWSLAQKASNRRRAASVTL